MAKQESDFHRRYSEPAASDIGGLKRTAVVGEHTNLDGLEPDEVELVLLLQQQEALYRLVASEALRNPALHRHLPGNVSI